jgi:hypothetical protein
VERCSNRFRTTEQEKGQTGDMSTRNEERRELRGIESFARVST